jgi:hypothetical protein
MLMLLYVMTTTPSFAVGIHFCFPVLKKKSKQNKKKKTLILSAKTV